MSRVALLAFMLLYCIFYQLAQGVDTKDPLNQNDGEIDTETRERDINVEEEMILVTDDREDGVFSTGGAGSEMEVASASPKLSWDPNGYFTFCPCMGQFGNQMEHYLGALAFGKAISRTIILPPFPTPRGHYYVNVPFTDWFQFEALLEFYSRLITMETFIQELEPSHWPEEERRGYCRIPAAVSDFLCDTTNGIPFRSFWDRSGINFAEEIKFDLSSAADITDELGMQRVKKDFNSRFPASEHPVLAFKEAPAKFPIDPNNRIIQDYIKWNPTLFAQAQSNMDDMFEGAPYVGIHLRNGDEWEKGCDHEGATKLIAAFRECHEPGDERLTRTMCFPPKDVILEQTREAIEKLGAKHLFIATDRLSYQKELEEFLGDDVKVHHLDPHLPQIDLIILGQADFFIGNCLSSFTAFVKRERDANNKPSNFWGRGL
ncbi:GDP-fucose protein O-fucosyltransferase 1-like [Diadema setosum]|uniref:GDP-fucose protein O-fucosyltransferase 1-like n=1 Tax=Diadema setosum TaxID=31175 RepID=UPI003B3BE185